MLIKPGADFENLEMGRAEKHAFVFGSGPMIVDEDEKRGLILAANRREFLSEFCTNIVKKSDKNPTNRPKKLPFSNCATREIVKVSRESSSRNYDMASVYNSEDLIKIAYPKWRHVSEAVKIHYHQLALRQIAEESGFHTYAFTMLLSPELGKQVILHGGSGYLHERLALKLNRTLGRAPVMWLMLEAVKTKSTHNVNTHGKGPVDQSNGLLHVHGAITLDSGEKPAFESVVRSINRSTNSTFKSNQIRTKPIKDDAYWVEYCNKHRFLNLMFLNGMQRYSRSKPLAGVAERIYIADKQKLRDHNAEK